jgi:hypothetical protein
MRFAQAVAWLPERWQKLERGAQDGLRWLWLTGAAGIRSITGLFEGEGGVVWMFLLLLIALVGMQA